MILPDPTLCVLDSSLPAVELASKLVGDSLEQVVGLPDARDI